MPSARAVSITLVVLLVLIAAVFRTSLGPGIMADPDEPPTAIAAFSTTPVAVQQTATALAAIDASPGPGAVATQPAVGAVTGPMFPDNRIVAYYGHPNDPELGILGQFDKQDLLEQLLDEVAAYEEAEPARDVIPAFEVIGSVAQVEPGPDGTHVLQTDDATIRDYIEFTQENNILMIIDIQIGKTSVEDELALIEEYLAEPNVHLAIDPEFAWGPEHTPGVDYGSINARDINYAQEQLARIVEEHDLPPKVLIVHRFTDGMVRNFEDIDQVENVQFVLDFDGYGDPPSKQEGYDLFVKESDAQHGGIKLFYDQDRPLMQPEDVLELDPAPDFVMYQ
jgi:hypothetical protein